MSNGQTRPPRLRLAESAAHILIADVSGARSRLREQTVRIAGRLTVVARARTIVARVRSSTSFWGVVKMRALRAWLASVVAIGCVLVGAASAVAAGDSLVTSGSQPSPFPQNK
jgi:hypothetical protein